MALQNRMNKTAQKIDAITQKMKEMESPTVKTDAYIKLEESLKSAKEELQRLRNEQAEWESMGISSGGAWDALCEKIGAAEEKVFEISDAMGKLEKSGGAFTNQVNTEAYKKATIDIENLNNEMEMLKVKEQEVLSKQNKINSAGFTKLGKSAQKASAGMKKLASESSRTNKGFSNLARTMKQMVLSMAVFQIMYKGLEFLKSGLQNLAVYSKEYNKSMSELMSSTSQLKNAFAVAFQPVLNVVIPILAKLIGYVSQAANAVSRFFAILGGKSTYTKAIKQNKDYAASLDKVGSAADKAKGSLASYDELEVMQKNDSSGGGGASGADGSGFIEESVGDTTKFEAIKKALEEIADIFKSGFMEGLGDWESRITDIQEKTQMIKDALIDIFTDPQVVNGAQEFGEAIIYNLGVVAGSVASIGLTIAQNLVGGIAYYLTENSGRIKEHLISMFDIGTDIANLLGNLSESIAYVFEAFGSESGQMLTGNLIGIFTDAFMGLQEVCASLTRDILNVIIQPFVDNKEAFRQALEGFLGVLAEICGTIKETIDHTFDHFMQVYDEHIKPFFDSVASGLSTLTGSFMEFWNTNVQPVMDNLAKKFDEVMGEHIQPMLEKANELIGVVADNLKYLWETVLQPFIAWIIENVLPVLLPIIDALLQGFLNFIGFVSDCVSLLLEVLGGLIEFIVGTFTGDWEKAWGGIKKIFSSIWDSIKKVLDKALGALWEKITSVMKSIGIDWKVSWEDMKKAVTKIFNDMWSTLKGVINSIIGGVESMANGVINAINSMIKALNGLKFTVPDWAPVIGGKSLGFNISTIGNVSIPRLANGGITTGSTLANIGEAGREAVIPLERNTEWMNTFADMLAGKIGGTATGPIELTVNLDGNQVYKRVVQLDHEFAGRTGRSQFAY